MTISLKPDFGPNDCFFPGLPKIRSLDIDLQVFTHRSFYARAAHVFEDLPGDLSPDNEKFEHLGDSVLQTCITTLLMEVFPGLRVGPATKIRSMIVANFTLAQISQKYRLPDRLRLHPAQAITLRASSNIRGCSKFLYPELTDPQFIALNFHPANVFEAFVGGLYVDQGLEPVQNWVYPLFRPYAIAAYRIAREQHGLPAMSPSFDPSTGQFSSNGTHQANGKLNGTNAQNGYHPEPSQLGNMSTIGHLALFNQHVQRSNKQVEWVYSDGSESDTAGDGNGYSDMPGLSPEVMVKGTKVTPVWYVKVIVDGQFFGKGRGNTKKAARNEAAKEGLSMLGIEVW
ncbi:ribonuclease III domain-containing protein [Gymnopilus junonius]|uniref:Ribonuclease III domain-containing protein n=1 Tax=Gymnopilus junonius TaxID=109634 RepID=A0A9P5TUM7_GYMJU|nr:ribonuclease III domain-containing protein [Gymnopilus junonius]